MVRDAYARVVALLTAERSRLDAIAEALLDKETLDEDEVYASAGVERPREAPLI